MRVDTRAWRRIWANRTIVVGNACACFDLKDEVGSVIAADEIQRAHLATRRAEFAEVMETDDVIAALRGKAAA